MLERNTCILKFNTSLDTIRNVRIPDPATGIDASLIAEVGILFIAANPFDETIGTLTGLANAELVKTITNVLI
jgi:hypothetical protein